MTGRKPRAAVATAGTAVAGLSTTTLLVLAQAPWWVAAMLIGAAVICVLVRDVFPQESAHRLEWWIDHRAARARRSHRRCVRPAAVDRHADQPEYP